MTQQTKTIEIDETIDVQPLIEKSHVGWWEYEMWCHMNSEWVENARPKRFNPLSKVDIAQMTALTNEDERLNEYSDLIEELEAQGLDHDTAATIAYNRFF